MDGELRGVELFDKALEYSADEMKESVQDVNWSELTNWVHRNYYVESLAKKFEQGSVEDRRTIMMLLIVDFEFVDIKAEQYGLEVNAFTNFLKCLYEVKGWFLKTISLQQINLAAEIMSKIIESNRQKKAEGSGYFFPPTSEPMFESLSPADIQRIKDNMGDYF